MAVSLDVDLLVPEAELRKLVKVKKGDRVKANQVLATVIAPELDAQYLAAEADARNKRVNAKRLTALAPAGITRAMFTSGGSESNELAIRIVRQYQLAVGQPDRWKIVSLQHSYHGVPPRRASATST